MCVVNIVEVLYVTLSMLSPVCVCVWYVYVVECDGWLYLIFFNVECDVWLYLMLSGVAGITMLMSRILLLCT